ncbi:hypothetical protein EVA_19147 [gut metagenome]|uniref:Uncharacterized protein n=1 Tax=gut metagenome TaxID=749906 RepID=J9FCX1_9ZZZZ
MFSIKFYSIRLVSTNIPPIVSRNIITIPISESSNNAIKPMTTN